MKQSEKVMIFFCLCLYFTCEISLSQTVEKYLYCIEKIYYENIFVKRSLYSLEDAKRYFLNQVGENHSLEDSLKRTVYLITEDPFLQIRKKDIVESGYYQERSVDRDFELRVYNIGGFRVYYISFFEIGPNMARKYRDYLKSKIIDDGLVVIDVTMNMGGSLWSAAYFCSMFLPANSYLFSVNLLKKGKVLTQNFYSTSDYGDLFTKNFVVVLQDDSTVSAAEVIPGVLKRRALIFGDLTYGKPYVQGIYDINGLSIVYSNGFVSFGLELEPHSRLKPDIYLSRYEIDNKEWFVFFVCRVWLFVRGIVEGG
ncbi:MAG: S41 family peptidase [bacterium]